MKKSFIYIAAIIGSLAILSCSRTVQRVDTKQQIDLSGRWNDTDSRLAAEELITEVLEGHWLPNFQNDNNGKKPVVIAGIVYNKSHEHIEAETFIKDIEKSFIRSQKVRLVQGGQKREEVRAERADQQTNSSNSTMKKWGLEIGADYMLQGDINSIVDAHKKEKVVYYQINLELTHLQTNEIVWIGDKKIKKLVKR